MHNRPLILLVDGNCALVNFLTVFLKRAGFEMVAAATPTEGWSLWRERAQEVALVISGLRFDQGPTGVAFLETICQADPAVKLVLSSGDYPTPEEWQWLHKRCIPFLPKPYKHTEILALINRLLSSENSLPIPALPDLPRPQLPPV